ncbi:MAG: putative rane protein [Burkholderiales bacterium]|jgi:putative membrane protein
MLKRKILKQMFQVATFAMMFGVASVHAQSDKSGAAASSKPAAASADSGSKLSKKDQKMMQEMAQSNIAEIEAGKLALTKTQNEKVKSFAQKMIDDHTKAQQDLQQVAQSKGVTLPTEPDDKHKAMAKKLSGLSGDKFDQRYMAQGGLADHKKTHRLLERASKSTDADVKNLAAKTQPVVEEHLSMAQQLQGNKATTDKTAATPADRARMAPSSSSGASSGAASSGGAASPGGSSK